MCGLFSVCLALLQCSGLLWAAPAADRCSAEMNRARIVKLTALLVLCAFAVFLVALLIRAHTFQPGSWQLRDCLPNNRTLAANFTPEERDELLSVFKGAIQLPTVSTSYSELNITALKSFTDYLPKAFPGVFSSDLVRHEIIANYSHLFTVRGSDPGLRPYILTAHLDVVPVAEEEWDFPPFSGEESDGYLYGRGTLDDKQSVVAILQGLEFLLRRGYRPRRSFYIGLGHDEEVGGYNGAKSIAAELQSRGVKPSFLLDEGSVILDGIISGLQKSAAVIATSEKGFATISLSVTTTTGHASIPPRETSIGILAEAVSRLEKNPMPRMFGRGPERAMIEHLTTEMTFPMKFIMANLWLFSSSVGRYMEQKPATNSLVRTTTTVTQFHAGIKDNVNPPSARALVDVRLHPAHTLKQLLSQIDATVADTRVKVEVINFSPSPPMSSYDETSFGYQLIRTTVVETFPDVAVAPGLCIGITDSRHYQNLTKELYRFSPARLNQEDLARIHGPNERIAVKNYEEIVQFFFLLIQNADFCFLSSADSISLDM
uniref:Putative carboxypeptidase PM20D1 n=1 Tax=Callorhinchus milii TaxID=7868 RepID=K4G071_CALMI|nr:putative carboxypeptidase PM20D1 precursor [Callorhinchus milii]